MSKYIRPVAAIAIVLVGLVGCGERQAKRLPGSGFRVAFESHDVARVMNLGKKSFANVTIKNISTVSWPSKPNSKQRYAVNLAYHWLNNRGQIVVFDGERTALPYDLKPGESVVLKAAISPPERAGAYTLEITMVQEAVAWFPARGGAKLSIPVKVEALPVDVLNSNGAVVKSLADVQSERESIAEKRIDSTPQKTQTFSKSARSDSRADSAMVGTATKRKKTTWSVQVGAFPEEKTAEQFAQRLRAKGYSVSIVVKRVKKKSWHQVRVGRIADRAEAKKVQQTLIAKENIRRSFITSLN